MSQTDVDQWAQAGTQALQQTQAQQVRNSVQQALPVNPDQEAQTRRFATAAQVPLDTARALPDVVKQKAQMSTFDADLLARSFPKTSQLLVNPDNARLLHDDIPTTASVEQAVKGLPPQPEMTALPDLSMGQRVMGWLRDAFGVNDLDRARAENAYAEQKAGISAADARDAVGGMSEIPTQAVGKAIHTASFGLIPDRSGAPTTTGGAVGAGLGTLAGFVSPGGPVKAAELISSKVAPRLLERAATDSFAKTLAKEVAGGALTLGTATALSNTGDIIDSPDPLAAGKKAALDFRSGAAMGAVFGAGGRLLPDNTVAQTTARVLGVNAALDASDGKVPFSDLAHWNEMDPTQQANAVLNYSLNTLFSLSGRGRTGAGWWHDAAKADIAVEDAQSLQQLGQLSAVSKLRERDPDAFKAFVNSVTEDGHLSEVYVDAKELTNALNQSGVTPAELQSVLPDVQAQLHEAGQTNGDVRIPVADYATHIAGTDIDTAILPHLKADPDGATYAQAQEFYKSQVDNLKATADKIVAEHVDSQAAGAARDKVRDHVLAQLNAVPQLDPRGNVHRAEVMGDYYTTMAARSGMTPEQFMQTYPVRFSDTRTVGGLEQGEHPQSLEDLKAKWDAAGISHTLSEKNGVITVSKIVVPQGERGAGKGTAAMKALTEYADATGQHIALSPSADFGGNKAKLVKFYKRLGFVENKGKNRAFTTSESMYRTAPGKVLEQSAKDVVSTPEFRNWFGASAAVDDAGKPKVLYHGTADDFSEFSAQEAGKNVATPASKTGFFFTDRPDIAQRYSEMRPGTQQTMPVYLSMQDPVRASFSNMQEADKFLAAGYKGDGAILEITTPSGAKSTVYAVKDANQIKSAIGNDGTFDKNDPNILSQEKRGQINFADDITKEPSVISLFKTADLSTFHHEMGHFFLEVQADLAAKIEARMAAGETVSPGEQGIAKDFETALAALGMKPAKGKTLSQTWQEMPLEGKSAGQSTAAEPMDGKRELHEKFARSYEAYLLEGKAPSVGLARAFQAFRSWMISVYRSLTGVGEKPSAELKGVFDRMLASDDAIKVAEQVRGYRPMFESAKDAGMTPEEFARYQQIGKDATADATDELQARSLRDMKWLSNGKSKIIRDLQREAAGKRREIREQVTKEVDEAPAFAAKRFLDEAKKDGPTPDLQIVADKFGFDTPDEMLRAIAERGNRKDIIEGLTDQRMLQAHGDLVDPSAIERAAEAAIHNEARARFVAAELKALAKATSPARQLALAAKEAADAAIAAKKVGDLRPAQYTAAEGRAARAAEKALAAGDLAAAASEKRAQLLNNRLAKAATDAVEQVRKDLAYLKKFDKASIRSKLPGDFVERIDDIRGALDLRQNPPEGNRRAEALLGWADGLRKLGYEPQIADWLNEMRPPMSYKDASVEQFRGVVDAVRSLEHIARAQKEVTVEGKKLALDDVVSTLTARMDQRGQKFSKEQLIERPSAKVDGVWRAVTHWLGVRLRMVHNDLTPQEFKFNKYDLHELEGPFRKTLFDPIIEANYRKVDLLKRQSDMGRAVGDALGKDWQKSLYEGVKNERLTDPDLSTPGNPVLMKMTRGRMLGIARHVGNESNFEKLTKGYGWNGTDVWAFLHANMTAKDWQATQAHWDSFDPLWKESEAMIRRQGGVPPPKIPAREFDTPHGKMRGGYSPLDYDPLRSRLSVRMGEFDLAPGDKVGEQMLYRATTTHNSSMVSRSEGYSDRVNLDFHSTDARIRDTIHDLAYREALLDAGKVVRDGRFRQKFMETYGREEYQALNDWLAGVRDMNVSDPRNRGFERAMQYSRQGVVLTGIGYRVSTVLKHGGAAALKSLGYLGNGEGAKYFAARVARMASGHLQEDLTAARDKFPEIRARLLQMDRDFKAGNRSMYETEGWQQKNDRFGHAMVAWSDALSATPTAWAAYDLARTSGVPVSMGGTGKPMTEEAAVKYASSIVRQAHGTALEATRSNFMQARGAKGFFGALYGFMNNTYGQTADMLDKSTSGGYFRNNPAVAARLMATLLVPALWTQWLKDGGPDDQHDPWYKWTGKAIASEVGAMVPFVRDAVALLEYGRGGTIAPMQMVTDAVNSGKDLWDEAHGKQTRLIQDLSNAMGEWAHIAGLGQLGHILQYARDVSEGKKHPQSDAQAVKEAVIGGAAKH